MIDEVEHGIQHGFANDIDVEMLMQARHGAVLPPDISLSKQRHEAEIQ